MVEVKVNTFELKGLPIKFYAFFRIEGQCAQTYLCADDVFTTYSAGFQCIKIGIVSAPEVGITQCERLFALSHYLSFVVEQCVLIIASGFHLDAYLTIFPGVEHIINMMLGIFLDQIYIAIDTGSLVVPTLFGHGITTNYKHIIATIVQVFGYVVFL